MYYVIHIHILIAHYLGLFSVTESHLVIVTLLGKGVNQPPNSGGQ